jgi:hypothetical protein
MKGRQAAEGGGAVSRGQMECGVASGAISGIAGDLRGAVGSFAKLAMLDIGFDRTNVLLVTTNLHVAKVPPDRLLATEDAIGSSLRTLPAVVSAPRSMLTPLGGDAWN